MSSKTLPEIMGEIQAKSKIIDQFTSEAGPDKDFTKVRCLGEGDTNAKVEKVQQLNKALSDLHDQYKALAAIVKARQLADESAGFNGQEMRGSPELSGRKSLGEMFVKSAAYTQKGATAMLDVDVKTIVRTGAGWAPPEIRLPRVELYPLRSLRVAEIFPTYPTGVNSIRYMEETTHTNNAAEIAEETNAAAPTAAGEAALAMTERSVPVEKIAVWIPVSDEQLADVAGIGQFIEDRLTYMVRNRLDGQLCAGDGNTPNLRGVLNASNIQSQALGTDPVLDAFFKAMIKVRGVSAGTGFGEPSACLIHPNDWQPLRLTRTADGIYLLGSPQDPGAERIWGVPVIVTSAETENTGVVGDFAAYSALYIHTGLEVQITNSHASLFAAGVQAIKATMRCAAVYFRGSAFCKVTGI